MNKNKIIEVFDSATCQEREEALRELNSRYNFSVVHKALMTNAKLGIFKKKGELKNA